MKTAVKSSLFSILFAASLSALPLDAQACGRGDQDGYLPQNNLNIPVRRTVYNRKGEPISGGLTEREFHGVIDTVERIYQPIIQGMGADFIVDRKWNDGTVNAYASRPEPNSWHVAMFGGLARHKEVTIDAFMLVVCHELGHHIGGAPKYAPSDQGDEWAGNEGTSDYFATLKCARRVLANEDNIGEVNAMYVPHSVRVRCETSFSNDNDAAICIRSALGGLALSRLLASLSDESLNEEDMPWFNQSDKNRVAYMYDGHPAAQCRLDTYYAGALCPIDYLADVDQVDPTINTCMNEQGYTFGTRPRCWYYPPGATDARRHRRGTPRQTIPLPEDQVYY